MKTIFVFLALGLQLFAGISEGDPAVDFNLHTLDGKKSYSMKSFKGQVVLLNLWASWCKGCKKEMPEFFDLQKSYKNGFKIVAVSIDDKAQKSVDFLQSVEKKKKMKTPFTVLHDPNKSLPKAYHAAGMPASYLIDKEGVVRLMIIGSLNESEIEQLKLEIDKLK